MRRRLAGAAAAVALAAVAVAQEAPRPAEFLTDLPAAQAQAKREAKPLLVLVAPRWFASPEVARLDKEVLGGEAARKALDGFVRVRVEESEDREVHVRHRLAFRGYPLAVVLDAEGAYVGSTAGLPAEDAANAWPARVAAIPARARRAKELTALLAGGEDPAALLELAQIHAAAEEPDRALALLERFENAAKDVPAERLGEARFLALRINAERALAERRFADVEAPCQKWLRRFEGHARLPDVLLLQANARYLAGDKDGAKSLWRLLVEKHPATDAAKRAKSALDAL